MLCKRRPLHLLSLATLVAACTMPAARATSDQAAGCNGKLTEMNVPITKQNAVANADVPAFITFDLPSAAEIRDGFVELTIRALKVDPQRKFIVTANQLGGEQIGQLAFYPPAKVGETYTFRVETSKLGAATSPTRMNLSVALVPLSQGQRPMDAAIEVVSAQVQQPKCK